MTNAVSVDAVSKRSGGRVLVDNVSLEIARGEMFALLGPQGAGKTALLRLLTGYLRPSAGSVKVAGINIEMQPREARAKIGYVPARAPLYPSMRVDRLLQYIGTLKGLRGRGVAAGVDVVCDQLALGPVRALRIDKLSREYRVRVAIAQALISAPPLLIFDEPTAGLDPRQATEITNLLKSLVPGHTVLIAADVASVVEPLADRVALLLSGKLLGVHDLRNGDGPARLRLRIRGSPRERVQAYLQGVPGVRSVEMVQPCYEGWEYLVHADGRDLSELLVNALVTAGYGIREVELERPSLQEVFLQLTSRQPR